MILKDDHPASSFRVDRFAQAPGTQCNQAVERREVCKEIMTSDFDLDEPLTFDVVAETVGARRALIVRLVRQGLIETLDGPADEPLVPRRAVVHLRRMQRLRRDLGVNFEGAAIILDLVGRIEQLNRELAEMHRPK